MRVGANCGGNENRSFPANILHTKAAVGHHPAHDPEGGPWLRAQDLSNTVVASGARQGSCRLIHAASY
jgi:hypothetical protein